MLMANLHAWLTMVVCSRWWVFVPQPQMKATSRMLNTPIGDTIPPPRCLWGRSRDGDTEFGPNHACRCYVVACFGPGTKLMNLTIEQSIKFACMWNVGSLSPDVPNAEVANALGHFMNDAKWAPFRWPYFQIASPALEQYSCPVEGQSIVLSLHVRRLGGDS